MKIVSVSDPIQKDMDGTPFPLVLQPQANEDFTFADFQNWITENRAALKEQLKDHGAILFRNFPIQQPEDFEALIEAGQFEAMPYVGGAAPRDKVTAKRVLTSNNSPSSEPIPFHHEMAQVPNPPAYIFFYCDIPSQQGGETAILFSPRIYQRFRDVDVDFANHVETHGVRYIRIMPSEDDPTSAIGRSWKSTFLTNDPEEAEAKMQNAGTTWEWLDNGNLRTETATLPAIRTEPRTGQKTFFNSMVAAYTGWVDARNDPSRAVVCGDGSPMNREAILATAQAMDEECVNINWRQGDMVWIDNSLVLHARRPFEGERRVLASIAKS